MSQSLPVGKSPFVQLLLVVAYAAAGLFIFQFFSLAIVFAISGLEFEQFMTDMSNPIGQPEFKNYMLFVQFLPSLVSFIVIPLLFIYKNEGRPVFSDLKFNELNIPSVFIAVGLTICLIIVDSVVIEWNMNIQFPEPFHTWASDKEEAMKVLTEYLTDFSSPMYFLAAFVTIAIVPAIGEELLFRGLIQKYLWFITKNPHVAIWLTAIFFSAFHIQFFGFVPRMLLGAFFGYLYYFSGNLIYAMLGHFVNNGLTVLMLYLYQNNWVSYDIENTDSIPLETVVIFAIIGIGLFVLYAKQFKNRLAYE
ncbi:CPBP family intramembrane metalloprotease [Reichenbachiella agarivorans]|uniref:CPBP family intramembrane metalloprotease n=1 Tax=Reichenbachiella agarivorans TaxID=2979464 RepID=A0ABY6CUC5_9BACT|nr:CPBP family intramembrane glutamic endopeptidase [Reichenbachiella agarivorans]UXP33494.1 CPBP family intramembrane metalloprotease [Reichenbachiella agarivorans]